ncbi:MAG TPA: glucose-6-phosphate isomerase [Actinomycetota bacterium]|nr:glucose-6-phosphate isomerase [Actinomycetota bacterium]
MSAGGPGASAAERLRDALAARLEALDRDQVPRRIWERDHTVWGPDPAEVADRLGWLTVHADMRGEVAALRAFAREVAAEGIATVVLAGMGGSSLAAEVFAAVAAGSGSPRLVVVDTTHPDELRALEPALETGRVLVVVASKSGTTIETQAHLAWLWERLRDPARFVAITDPGTPLARAAEERGFRRTFLNPPDIGGRYSALSYFGLVPAALVGADLEELLGGAAAAAGACGPDVPAADNPGVRLGALLGEGALLGRDKLTLALPEPVAPLGAWLEQLIAESTGKRGRGILPVEGAPLGPPAVYGDDPLFVALGEATRSPILAWLERAGHPVERLEGEVRLGAEMFRWELATAVAGAVLGVNPFDQPDVQAAKDRTARVLAGEGDPAPEPGDVGEVLAGATAPAYLAIQAFLPRTEEVRERLRVVRLRLRDRLRVAVTVGFGPRYLHSTGQLHKGGPPTGRFVQVVEDPAADVAIPGQPYTFRDLLLAQAAGDMAALRERGRPVARTSLAGLEAAAG